MNNFTDETAIDYFAGTDTVHIATEPRNGEEVITPIWAVVVDGAPYIRSGYGHLSPWYRRLQLSGSAVFVNGAHRYPVTLENLHDEAINRKVDDAYRAKYAGQGWPLCEVISPQVRARTMRITLQR
jgi:hypothetical protein